jgi:hypothetical protein
MLVEAAQAAADFGAAASAVDDAAITKSGLLSVPRGTSGTLGSLTFPVILEA